MTIGIHLVLSGYGTWLSNDPRGSGSVETCKDELRDLGEIHQGRKRVQPSRRELKAFYAEAEPLLDYPTLWFDTDERRRAIGEAFGRAAREHGYTVWACAVCSNHGHVGLRVHRDDHVAMFDAFANAGRLAMLQFPGVPEGHPVWASRPYAVLLTTPDEVVGRIDYIRQNPMKEGLPEQHWSFVAPYDGWPFHKRRGRAPGRR
jgi:hypothetical protein